MEGEVGADSEWAEPGLLIVSVEAGLKGLEPDVEQLFPFPETMAERGRNFSVNRARSWRNKIIILSFLSNCETI